MIPPEQDAEFVAAMEDVLEVYHRPYSTEIPVVCMDEQPVQFTQETRKPLPMEPGQPQRFDHEYERNGTASIFMFNEPKAGIRSVSAHEHRTMTDWAHSYKASAGRTIPRREKGHSGVR